MELNELEHRLAPFCRHHLDDPEARVTEVWKMPGHAGFAYGFGVHSNKQETRWFLRLPPPNVQWRGTADVLRQAAVLNALDGEPVPHCSVQWSGADLRWFERPYFVVPVLEGDVVRTDEADWTRGLDQTTRRHMARQAMTALSNIHRVPWRRAADLGDPISLPEDVERWDRFVPKAADPERLALQPRVRELLMEAVPESSATGIFHGDFQWANLFYSLSGELLAVIDWELVGIGATLNDVGWIATFNDPEAWDPGRGVGTMMPQADELLEMYSDAYNETLPDIAWFRALAAYKFAIISGFNLMLHRRGKRHDPKWEEIKESIEPLMTRAKRLLEDK